MLIFCINSIIRDSYVQWARNKAEQIEGELYNGNSIENWMIPNKNVPSCYKDFQTMNRRMVIWLDDKKNEVELNKYKTKHPHSYNQKWN